MDGWPSRSFSSVELSCCPAEDLCISATQAGLNDQSLESDFVFYQRTVTGAFAMPLLEHQGVETLAETLPYNSHL